jgi:hypothetical protein
MPPKKFDDEGTGEELTRADIFTGADHHEDDDDDLSAADRGDDATASQQDDSQSDVEVAAAPDEESVDTAAPTASDDEMVLETADDNDVGESEDAPDGEDDPKISPYVTKERFNAVNERMQAAEKALREAQARADEAPLTEEEAPPAFDFDSKEMEYMELVTDGEFERAKAIRQEIRAAERAEIAASTQNDPRQTASQVQEAIKFEAKANELAAEFDLFNPNHPDYDQVLVDEAVDRRDMFIQRGLSAADAIDKAAREVAKLYDIPSNYAEANPQVEPKKGAVRKPDMQKKLEQASKQPAKMDEGSPDQGEAKNALNMKDDEFDALPEATKARMRGDIL